MAGKNIVTFSFPWAYESFSAELVPLKRKTIYGERKILAVDKDNQECKRIMYDESDMSLFPAKSLGTCRLDSEGKIYSNKNEGIKAKEDSEYNEFFQFQTSLEEIKPDDPFIFPTDAKNVYTLEGYDTLAAARIIGDKIFYYKRSDLVFQRKGTVFWIKPEKGRKSGEYAKKSVGYQPDDEPIISDITSLDDIDFDMF